MKKIVFAILGTILAATFAFGGSSIAPAVGRTNVPLTVPKPANAICKSLAVGKTGTASFDVSGTSMVNWRAQVNPNTSTAVILNRKLNTNTYGYPGSEERNLPISASTTALTFGKYSSSDNSVTPYVCLDAN